MCKFCPSFGYFRILVCNRSFGKIRPFGQLTEASVLSKSSKKLQLRILPKLRQKVQQKLQLISGIISSYYRFVVVRFNLGT